MFIDLSRLDPSSLPLLLDRYMLIIAATFYPLTCPQPIFVIFNSLFFQYSWLYRSVSLYLTTFKLKFIVFVSLFHFFDVILDLFWLQRGGIYELFKAPSLLSSLLFEIQGLFDILLVWFFWDSTIFIRLLRKWLGTCHLNQRLFITSRLRRGYSFF